MSPPDAPQAPDRPAAPASLTGLNPVQSDAVTHAEGPLLVVAGAGSGKTRVLTHRIAHLIRDRGVSPFAILAITFTNRAADEMKSRVAALVGPVAEKMWVSTFHSACVRILRRDADLLGYPRQFTIYDEADAVRLTGYVIRDLGLDTKRFPPRSVHAAISAAKNDGVDAETYTQRAGNLFERKIGQVFAEYQSRLHRAGSMDFDDLLTNALRLLREHPQTLRHYQERFRHILVDEYQDTNRVQNELVLLLAADHRNIAVVGDQDQCLPPGTLVTTPAGARAIEALTEGETVIGVGATGRPVSNRVTAVTGGHYAGRMYTVHAGGRSLRGTPHHVALADTSLDHGRYIVYLMERIDRGFRLGLTKSVRAIGPGQFEQGIRVRINQEHADRAWVLRVCDTRAEAGFYEAFYAATYGLPTALFHGLGRNLTMDDEWLARLFDEVDTRAAAKQLMEDLDLHPAFPQYTPANGGRRQTLNLTMFSDCRHGDVGYHRVQWSSNRVAVAQRLGDAGMPVRAGKPGSYRVETSHKDYRQALAFARLMATAGGLEIRRRAVVAGKIYPFVPLAHLREGMKVLLEDGDDPSTLVEARVDAIEVSDYDGPVYDLEVEPTHTYVADGVLVHNSIYRFRGADMRNIVEFEDAFPDTTVVLLEQNYRSTQTILDAANAVIAHNVSRKPKELWTDQGAGDPIVRYHADDEVDEAQWITREMARLHDEQDGLRWGDIAVFYRTNAQSRVLEEQLMRVGIPYRVLGGTRFYDRKEVKDAVAYLRAVVNPVDEVSIKRVLNEPKRGVGATSVGRLDAWATAHGLPFLDALRRADDAGVSGKAARGIEAFLRLLDEVADTVASGPGPLLQALLERSGYLDALEAERTIESEGRLENLAELVGAASEVASVDEFLESISLVSDVDDLDEADQSSVVLMTLHAAKGLEFPVVFIIGLEDGVFPHLRSLTEPDQLEEERRLAYVGITRARQRLYLTHAWSRTLFGGTQYNPPSRFLDEIPEGLIHDVEGHRRSSRSGRSYGGVWGRGGRDWRSGGPSRDAGSSGADGSGADRGLRVAAGRDRIVENALKPRPPSRSGAESLGLEIGDDVRHKTFGEGVIIDMSGSGDKTEARVRFRDVGEKTLLLSWAPLEKL
ncbi:MAG TPA: UvrD-helicase domain-containing protein [Acidimicrobiales bacterium]|nr:UvrD-helicase domain-containing protein [Acidimicrobiales bacterium]